MKSLFSRLLVGGLLLATSLAISPISNAQKGPFTGGKDATQQVSAEKLAKLEKEYKAAKKASVAKPKDAKLKKKYVDSAVAFGLGNEYAETLPPNKKYRLALQYFREALKLDPKNKIAKEQINLIESIYKSMGKEIPK